MPDHLGSDMRKSKPEEEEEKITGTYYLAKTNFQYANCQVCHKLGRKLLGSW